MILRCGENEADGAYIRGAVKRGALCGVEVELRALPADATAADVREAIREINGDDSVHGCLLLRPLPPYLRAEEDGICACLDPRKDVDGMTQASAAGAYTGHGQGFAPCTAQACVELLRYYGVEMAGKHAVVIGRSAVVGRPAAMLLLREDAAVTVCHSRTPDTAALTRQADIIITAAGVRSSLTAAYAPRTDGGGRVRKRGRLRPVRRRRLCGGGAGGGRHHPCARRRGRRDVLGADGAHGAGGGAADRGGTPVKLFTPAETVANYAATGAVKTQQTFGKLLLLGVAA